ncbi:MAG: hypothetical protein AAGA75_25705 [Cyanobacteria bacterium P01_E01_bin.6]
MLSESIKATLKDAACQLTSAKKRALTAQVRLDYLSGSARKAETVKGWGRKSVQRGRDTLTSRVPYPDEDVARGRNKWEAVVPHV